MTESIQAIPKGYHTLTPSLVVKGADRLVEFLIQVFEAKEMERLMMPDGTIAHSELQIGDSRIMLGEASTEWPAMPSRIYMYVGDADATYQRALQAGASSVRKPEDQFYGDRNTVVKDSWGNVWTIATRKENLSSEEMRRRMPLQSSQSSV